MNRAIERAWSRAPRIGRFWVHTCTNDHPDALAFYIRSGFVPYARGVECYPDPRLEGLLSHVGRTADPDRLSEDDRVRNSRTLCPLLHSGVAIAVMRRLTEC